MRLFFIVLITSLFNLSYSQSNLKDKYDVKQYILDLQISNISAQISGSVIINANVSATYLDTFAVDLIDTIVPVQTYMVVDSVFVNGVLNSFQHHDELVFVPLTIAIPQNQQFSVQIYYHGNGNANVQTNYNGISKAYYTSIWHAYTLSQPTGSKVWWPCKQDLKDKADSVAFFITTDSTNKSGSNGTLKSTEYLPGGKVKYKWETKYPIAYYLISFAVGPYSEYITHTPLPGGTDSVLLQNFLIPASSYYQDHIKAINKTKQLIYLYSELIGIYPFKDEKYGYCVVGNPHGAAMENQTMCTIGYELLDTTSTEFAIYFYTFVTAHELGHQWFGDYVTCAKWNDIWLNEGFASYMEYIALQNLESQTSAEIWIQNAHTEVKSLPDGSVFVPDSLVLDYYSLFDYRLIYKKGASILHTLRYEINNDSLFFAVLRNYLSAYAFSTSTVDDFKQVAESITGINFSDYFDQWYYGQGYPIFNINWNQNNDTLIIISDQTTSTNVTSLFKTHFDLRVNSLAGDTIIRLFQGTNHESYKIYISETVTSIEFDPYFWLIQNNTVSTGIEKNNNSISFNLFPNPAERIINVIIDIGTDFQNSTLYIYDMQGQLLKQQPVLQSNSGIDISIIEKGMYIVKVKTEKGIAVKRFVKE